MLRPTLTGQAVTLRPIRSGDYELLLDVASDPLLWEQHPARDRWKEPEFRSYYETWLNADGTLVIVERASGRVIGASRYSLEDRWQGEIEIGWTFIARDYWGGSTNGEVKRLMIGHALELYERVVFRVAASNARSRRALEKIGARLTERTEMIEVAGQPTPHLVYGIERGTGLGRQP